MTGVHRVRQTALWCEQMASLACLPPPLSLLFFLFLSSVARALCFDCCVTKATPPRSSGRVFLSTIVVNELDKVGHNSIILPHNAIESIGSGLTTCLLLFFRPFCRAEIDKTGIRQWNRRQRKRGGQGKAADSILNESVTWRIESCLRFDLAPSLLVVNSCPLKSNIFLSYSS